MFTIIGNKNFTEYVSSVSISISITDPMPTASLHVEDPNSLLSLDAELPIILWDDAADPIDGVQTIPSVNLVIDPTFDSGGANYGTGGDTPGAVSFASSSASFVYSNSDGLSFAYQDIL